MLNAFVREVASLSKTGVLRFQVKESITSFARLCALTLHSVLLHLIATSMPGSFARVKRLIRFERVCTPPTSAVFLTGQPLYRCQKPDKDQPWLRRFPLLLSVRYWLRADEG